MQTLYDCVSNGPSQLLTLVPSVSLLYLPSHRGSTSPMMTPPVMMLSSRTRRVWSRAVPRTCCRSHRPQCRAPSAEGDTGMGVVSFWGGKAQATQHPPSPEPLGPWSTGNIISPRELPILWPPCRTAPTLVGRHTQDMALALRY